MKIEIKIVQELKNTGKKWRNSGESGIEGSLGDVTYIFPFFSP
jgi:hypothetical protein